MRTAVSQLCAVLTLVLFWLGTSVAPCGDPQESPSPAVGSATSLWFGDVRASLPLSIDDGNTLCKAVFAALQTGRQAVDTLPLLANDDSPRVIFISWTDGKQRAHVCFGTGSNLGAAVADACAKIAKLGDRIKSPLWLKLDIVQHAHLARDFFVRESSLPLPSLTGIAFSQASGFAFLPEQLIGWQMVDVKRRLRIHRISEFVLKGKNWEELGKWSKITSHRGPQAVFLFECQSFFYSGAKAVNLYRGHLVPGKLTPEAVLDSARQAGEFLVRQCNAKGQFKANFPEWQGNPEGCVALSDQAGTIIALLRLHEVTKKMGFRDAAERATRHLLTFLRPYSGNGKAACIVDDYRTLLETNAMTVLALLKLRSVKKDSSYGKELVQLGRYLLQQVQPGGVLVCERSYPAGQINSNVSLSASALTVRAFVQLYEETGHAVFLRAAKSAINVLLETSVNKRDMDKLPQDESLLQAIDAYFTYDRREDLVKQTERLALSIVATQTWKPDFPDFLGSVNNYPSATLVAKRTRALTAAARLLLDTERTAAAKSLLGDLQLNLIFQLQAQMRAPAAMYLGKPQRYLGTFRDHLLDFGFALHCQYVQILSTLETYELVNALPEKQFPPNPCLEKNFKTTWKQANCFPRCLPRSPQ